MDASTRNIDPSVGQIMILAVLLALICSALYLVQPDFIQQLQFKMTDTIVAAADDGEISDQVVVVEIDESALEAWGQWPWSRSRIAALLKKLTDMGARCVALDFIMAEPDRTPPTSIRSPLNQPTEPLASGRQHPNTLPDNDTILADTLARGPYVLGYEFFFNGQERDSENCHLRPLELIDVQKPSDGASHLNLYQAQGLVCNMEPLAHSAPHAGFLNGRPDSDGRLRRLPLIIEYANEVYPNLTLAALMATAKKQTVMLKQHRGRQNGLVLDDHTIPIDDNGNLRIRFSAKQSKLRHLSADWVLSGRVDESEIKGRLVLVGLAASGLAPTYQTPARGLYTAVDIHAQAIETVLSANYIWRNGGIIALEVIWTMMVAVFFGFCISRLEFMPTVLIGATVIAGCWGGAQLLFGVRQILISPLLPIAVILSGSLVLMLFKYWTRQLKARQSMQDALILMKSSQDHLNAIIKTIPDIVFRLDATGRITFISPALIRYRKHPEVLIGQPILDLVAKDDQTAAAYRINERRTGKRATTNLEVRLLLSSAEGDEEGTERYFSVSAEGIYGSDAPDTQSFLGTQGIARDINQRKHLEHKLEQSRRMEAIGGLAAGVAHDLNNILSGLVSYPELVLLDLPSDSPMRENIATIQRSGQRAADVVQDLLLIARRGVKNHSIIDVNETIAEYLASPEFIQLSETHPGVGTVTELSDDLMNVKGSSIHIQKVIMNLVGNAAEAMPAGGTIYLSTFNRYLDTALERYERIPEGEYVVLRIADEGIGIPADALDRLFEPFYSRKRMGRSGSGLGMTVVWNSIKDHAGYVDIQSQEGHGTRFDVYLAATREANHESQCRVVLQDYTGTERILVVDDIPEQLDIAVRMLGKLGYHVATASGGEAAIDHLQTHTVDLLVLDMVMPPGIDGLETYRRILERVPGQKAIIASGYAPSDRVKAMQAMGAGDYIRKPYTLEKIGMAVRCELDNE